MGNLLSQSFQHQINWKNIFLVASTYHYWDPKCGRLENFGFWKKQSAINLVSFCFWQMYVVIHFWTYLHFEWIKTSSFVIRIKLPFVFRSSYFLHHIHSCRSGCRQSQKGGNKLLFNGHNKRAMVWIYRVQKPMWDDWDEWWSPSVFSYISTLHRTTIWACEEGPTPCNSLWHNVQRSWWDTFVHSGPWSKPLVHRIFIFPFSTTTRLAHAHFPTY